MKSKFFVIIVSALLLIAKVYAYDDGGSQVWNTDVEELRINNNAKITFEEEFRWGGSAHEFCYQHYDVGFFYNPVKWLNIGGGYRHVYELKKGRFKLENEPYMIVTLLWDIKGFRFEDRHRMEFRHFDYQNDSWRYRNKATVKLPWSYTRMKIRPYLSDEIFFDSSGISKLNQNRLSSGLAINMTRNLNAEIYYMLRSTKNSGKWIDANVLGTNLRLTF
jgi:hypothetical protein